MNKEDFIKQRENRILTSYDEVSSDVKEDLEEALAWAKKTLKESEGGGHNFQVLAEKKGLVCCTFSKPSWSGEHCSRGMESASEAIVMAVCEYLNGA